MIFGDFSGKNESYEARNTVFEITSVSSKIQFSTFSWKHRRSKPRVLWTGENLSWRASQEIQLSLKHFVSTQFSAHYTLSIHGGTINFHKYVCCAPIKNNVITLCKWERIGNGNGEGGVNKVLRPTVSYVSSSKGSNSIKCAFWFFCRLFHLAVL